MTANRASVWGGEHAMELVVTVAQQYECSHATEPHTLAWSISRIPHHN